MNHSRGLFWLLIVLLGLLLGCESASEPSTSPLALGGELERSGEGTLSGETGIQSEGREDSTALEGIPVEGSGEGQERETALPDTGTDDPSSPSDSPASEEGQEENEDLPFEEPTCVENHCDFLFASATPPICQQGASCSTDSECPSSWAAAGQCTEGVCTSVQTECETASDCLAACEAAAALVEPGAFLDCSAQQWDCSPYSDCPNAPKLCTPVYGVLHRCRLRIRLVPGSHVRVGMVHTRPSGMRYRFRLLRPLSRDVCERLCHQSRFHIL